MAAGDRFLVAWDDNVSSYIGMVTTNTTQTADTYIGQGSLSVVQIVKLTGIANAATSLADNDIDLLTD